MSLADILKDSNYKLSQFKQDEIDWLEQSIFYVWKQILEDEGIAASHLFSVEDKPPRCEEYVKEKVFAIDFDEKAVRVARTLNLIAGDGQTNVLHLNTLDYERWDERIKDETWQDVYFEGFKRLRKLRPKGNKDYREFQFDVLMANPPFAGDIKESRIISRYDLGKKPNGKWQNKLGRDMLFIERNLDFLKPGGRMAIVLPQGRFNNSSDKQIRDYIAQRCRILAVVGLHGNTFKPHTGTKTSVLLVQKWNDDPKRGALCPKQDDYNIFFATMRKSGKDNSGEKIYRRIPPSNDGLEGSKLILDPHDHLVVDHDLYNHDEMTEDGIAEAFIEFAKKEKLSFFEIPPSNDTLLNKRGWGGSFDAEKYKRLMDRLEAVEVKFSYVTLNNDAFRFDSDYFRKDYLSSERLIKSKAYSFLEKNISDLKSFGAYSLCNSIEYIDEGIPFLRCVNIKDYQVDFSNALQINSKSHKLLWKSEVEPNMILLTMSGSAGRVAIAQESWKYPINSNQDIAKIVCLDNISPYYLYIYLSTKHGTNQIHRQLAGSVQQHIFLWQIEKLIILEASNKFLKFIELVAKLSNSHLEQSKNLYQQAEELLLSKLGLKDWQPTEENIAVKSFAESFGKSDRLDAEHYQPKFDQLIQKLKEKVELIKLGEILTCNQRGKQPSYLHEDENHSKGLTVVNSKHVREGQVIINDNRYADYPNGNNPLIIQTNDVLINGTGVGTIGRCATYLYEQKALPDTEVTVLRSNKIDSIYLSIYLNSILGQLQVEKYLQGSSGIIRVYPKDIAELTA